MREKTSELKKTQNKKSKPVGRNSIDIHMATTTKADEWQTANNNKLMICGPYGSHTHFWNLVIDEIQRQPVCCLSYSKMLRQNFAVN